MIEAGATFENPRTGTRLEVRDSTPQQVVFDRRYPAHTGRADAHVHFDIEQSWEVLAGRARATVEGETRELRAGDKIEIKTGVRHQDVHNPYDEEASVRWTVWPANDFVQSFADAYTHLLIHDKLNDQDEFKPLQLFPVLHATHAESWLARVPIPVQRLIIPVGAWLGRRRGYSAHYGED